MTDMGTPVSRRTALGGMGAVMALPLVGSGVDLAPASRRVEGKVALVTGSSRNLGRATVLELARRPHSVDGTEAAQHLTLGQNSSRRSSGVFRSI